MAVATEVQTTGGYGLFSPMKGLPCRVRGINGVITGVHLPNGVPEYTVVLSDERVVYAKAQQLTILNAKTLVDAAIQKLAPRPTNPKPTSPKAVRQPWLEGASSLLSDMT